MRTRTRWHRGERNRSAAQVGDAVAFTSFGLARETISRMRKAGFGIAPGPRYFALLGEALVYAIQCACRTAWPRLGEEERQGFAEALARSAARHLAENEADMLGERPAADIAHDFIAHLNRRFAEYAELGYGAGGPDFAFMRYYATLITELVPPADVRWVHDQVIAIEAPVTAATLDRTVAGLLDNR